MSQTRYVGVVAEVKSHASGPVWITLQTGDGRSLAWRTDDESTARRARARLAVGDRVTMWVKKVGPFERVVAFGPYPDADDCDGGTPVVVLGALVVGAASLGAAIGQWVAPLLGA